MTPDDLAQLEVLGRWQIGGKYPVQLMNASVGLYARITVVE
jgi:hypothetical protein